MFVHCFTVQLHIMSKTMFCCVHSSHSHFVHCLVVLNLCCSQVWSMSFSPYFFKKCFRYSWFLQDRSGNVLRLNLTLTRGRKANFEPCVREWTVVPSGQLGKSEMTLWSEVSARGRGEIAVKNSATTRRMCGWSYVKRVEELHLC